MSKVDLSDLFTAPPKKAKSNVISLDDLVIEPRVAREAIKVVLFWTDWTCSCGRHYEMPTYGDTLTQYQIYRYGKPHYVQYEPYLPANHADLPREVETRHIVIGSCPACLMEDKIEEHRHA